MADATVSGAHAQQVMNRLGYRMVTLSAAAEDANTIAVSVQLVNTGGTSLSEAAQCIARVVGEPAADYTIAETGGGTELSVTAHTGLVFTLSAAGAATITVTDVSGASGETVYLEVYPVNVPALVSTVACTFD